MIRRGIVIATIAVLMAALAVACKGGGEPATTPTATAASTDQIAFILSPGVSSVGRSQHWSGLGSADIYLIKADGTGLRRLTSARELDAEPVWSPDGRSIAFVSYRDRNGEIYVMKADGTGVTRLTNTPDSDECCPIWSPGGRFIAYFTPREVCVVKGDGTGMSCATENQQARRYPPSDPLWSPDGQFLAFESSHDGNLEIYVMKADGTGVRRLTNTPEFDIDPTWSPDGRTLAFATNRDGNSEIYVMKADGTGLTNITNNPANDSAPAWSPDGRSIAFNSYRDDNPDIYVMKADGTDLRRLTNNPGQDRDPVWSPDGQSIAFETEQDGNQDIHVMKADGTGLTRLPKPGDHSRHPVWSPNGRFITFQSGFSGNWNAYIVKADGTGLMDLTKRRGACCATWSPDGQTLAFASHSFNEICAGRVDGNSRCRPAPDLGLQRLLAWSPDGRFIAVDTLGFADQTAWEIYVMKADGTGLTNLTNSPEHNFNPVWSPDSRSIAFETEQEGNRDIHVMKADGTGLVNLTNSPGQDLNPVWSPDGRFIAFQTDRSFRDRNYDIYLVQSDGTGLRHLTSSPGKIDSEPAWSPDGRSIAFTTNRTGTSEIFVINADGTGLTNLTKSPGDNEGFPFWSPDGRRIAFTRNGDIYAMQADGTGVNNLTNSPDSGRGYPVWSPNSRFMAFSTDRGGNLEIYVVETDGTGLTNLTNSPDNECCPVWGNVLGDLKDGTTVRRTTPVPVSQRPITAPPAGATAVSAGFFYTCAVTAAGGVRCWGNNDQGQLGDGTTYDRGKEADVIGLTSGVATVSVGQNHTCALTRAGGVKCWGDNSTGQLGDGTGGPGKFSTITVNVVGLTRGAAAVSVGSGYSCALTTAGGVKCWGAHFFGKLGGEISTTPMDVVGLTSGAVAISAGAYQACAVTSAGSLKCWVPRPPVTNLSASTPVEVTGLTSGVAAVSAGWTHICAVTTAGGLKCWGRNNQGQLGDGTTTDRTAPVDVVGLTTGVTAVSAGNEHTCVLTTAGGVKCWGANGSGQLGDGTGGPSKATPGLVDVVGLTNGVAAVSAGGAHTCAVTAAGGLGCWGNNGNGELGTSIGSEHRIPSGVVGFSAEGLPTKATIPTPTAAPAATLAPAPTAPLAPVAPAPAPTPTRSLPTPTPTPTPAPVATVLPATPTRTPTPTAKLAPTPTPTPTPVPLPAAAAPAESERFHGVQTGPTEWTYTLTYEPHVNYAVCPPPGNIATIRLFGLKDVVSATGPTSTDFIPTGSLIDTVNLQWVSEVSGSGTVVTWRHVGPGTGNFTEEKHVFGFKVFTATRTVNGTVNVASDGFSIDVSLRGPCPVQPSDDRDFTQTTNGPVGPAN